jgi:hypothetical protein
MHRFTRAVAERVLPTRTFTTLQSIRSRNYQKRLFQRTGHSEATVRFIAQHGCEVLYGPFRGMRYPKESILSRSGVPLLLGNYELELHEVIESRKAEDYNVILDIGCAEGYYAVGLARRLRVPVHAFDTEFRERNYCWKMAVENRVERLVDLYGWCSPTRLRQLARGRRALVICDCEGFEVDLFDRETIKDLTSSDLLVELHDVSGVDVKSTLCDRLAVSHEICLIPYTGVGPLQPELDCLGPEGPRFNREMRIAGQEWLWAPARA